MRSGVRIVVALILLGGYLAFRMAMTHDRPVVPTGVPAPADARTPPFVPPPARGLRGGPMVEPRDLSIDESRGGHTLARHVGRTDAELRQRLADEPNISAASTYTNRQTAELTIARALAERPNLITSWLNRDGPRPNFEIEYRGREVIGRSLRRGRSRAVPVTDARVVLRWIRDRDYFVLTSYPEERE